MEITAKYRPATETIVRRIAGETLLVPIHGELATLQRLCVLDPVGEHIWAWLDGQHDVAALRDLVASEWSIPAAQAEDDLCAFLVELQAAGLIVEA